MPKVLARLILGICFVFAATAVSSRADASCYTPLSRTTTYSAYVNNGDGSFYSCTYVIISPPIDYYTHWDVIGQRTVECDGSVTSWGNTTTCTAPANKVTTINTTCDQICE